MDLYRQKEQIIKDLNFIRNELISVAGLITPEELDWAPKPDMKSIRYLLQEIGIMEQICVAWISDGVELPWDTCVAWSGDTLECLLADLAKIRQNTLSYIADVTNEQLNSLSPALWGEFMGCDRIEPARMLHWLSKHEYYHLGQIVTYRWILGANPYYNR